MRVHRDFKEMIIYLKNEFYFFLIRKRVKYAYIHLLKAQEKFSPPTHLNLNLKKINTFRS